MSSVSAVNLFVAVNGGLSRTRKLAKVLATAAMAVLVVRCCHNEMSESTSHAGEKGRQLDKIALIRIKPLMRQRVARALLPLWEASSFIFMSEASHSQSRLHRSFHLALPFALRLSQIT